MSGVEDLNGYSYLGRTMALFPYRAGDENRFKARGDFAKAFAAEGRLPDGLKWTLKEGATVWAVGGFEPLGDGQWGAWAYAADMPPRAWVTGARMARGALLWMFKTFRPTRVAAEAAPFPAARRLLARIGMRQLGGVSSDLFAMTSSSGLS
jgi:hypothetical protein